jgi:hypothetical protein
VRGVKLVKHDAATKGYTRILRLAPTERPAVDFMPTSSLHNLSGFVLHVRSV